MGITAETKPENLEARVAKLEAGKKDWWDKFQIVGTLLIPASITIAGYLYSQAMSKAGMDSAQRAADQQNATALISARVGQAQLVSSFMDALLSPDAQRQRLAVEAVLIALPEDGPRLVSAFSEGAKTETRDFARGFLGQHRDRLVQNMTSDQKPVRAAATQDLVRGWSSDREIVPKIVAAVSPGSASPEAVSNAVTVLESADKSALRDNSEKVAGFLKEIEAKGIPISGDLLRRLRDRLKAAD